MKHSFQTIVLTLLTAGFLIYSCKKEISCEGCETNQSTNKHPIAKAGNDSVITLPTDSILLDGSASYDPDGSIKTWQWKKISGPSTFTIVNTNSIKIQVSKLTVGIYQFELKVTDAGGLFDRDTMQVMVDDPQVNQPPVANAGADTTISLPVNAITLNGSSSADPDNNITSYQWTKISGPVSSTITNVSAAITTASLLTSGIYLFELKVMDAGGLFDKDTMQVTVNPIIFTNHPPVANAGNDTTITLPANTINLDGSRSTDPDNNITNYQWAKISGSASFNIVNANTVHTQVTNLTEAVYQFELTVTDAGGLMSKDTVKATVLPPTFIGNRVYIAGWGSNVSGKKVARLWNNNVMQDLSDGQRDAYANSVFLSGTDVYVAGHEKNANGKTVAKLWKNGIVQNLSNGLQDAYASSVFVSGPDVYVAGAENAGGFNYVAKLWKNGMAQNLSDGQTYADANSVFVTGSDVYVAGIKEWIPTLWKNGVAQNLPIGDCYADEALSVFVSGNDVYVAGGLNNYCNEALLWKNGVRQNLDGTPDNLPASSVFVVGSDVYVAGNTTSLRAVVWKNGFVQNLGYGHANSVFVSGNDVYVVGTNDYNGNGNAKVWKNGAAYSISELNWATSVFVQ